MLLGESPSRQGDRYHAFPLSGAPAERICRLMGWEGEGAAYWRLTEHFETLNAIERHADADPWSKVRARERWTRWLLTRPPAEQKQPLIVVCLGRRAADAVGLNPEREWGEWFEAGLLQAVIVPHTSGRNRVLNDPEMRDLLKRVLTEALERAGKAT